MYEAKAMLHVVMGVAVVMTMMMLSDVTGRCPATCFCQQSSWTVYCSRRGLDAVPDTVPPGTRQLHLNGNHFKSSVIRRANFSRFPDVVFEVSESVLIKIIAFRNYSLFLRIYLNVIFAKLNCQKLDFSVNIEYFVNIQSSFTCSLLTH